MKRCTRCLMPDSRPDTRFEDGVCSACIAYDARKEIDWEARKDALGQLLDQRAVPGQEFDCIVPSSGGKDSTYQVVTLLELGICPLVVTATTCHLTPIGRRNIDNLARLATTIEVTPNRDIRAKINRLALEIIGDISWPEHVLIHTVPFKIAKQMGIPLVMYGENPLNQYGSPDEVRQNGSRMTRQWVSEFGGFLGMRPSDFVGMEGITERDMSDYMPIDGVEDIDVRFLGYYLPWDSHHNAKVAAKAGMEQVLPTEVNWWKHENLDNAQTIIHDFIMLRKYGYGRACAQMSVDIRSGLLDRAPALYSLLPPREQGLPNYSNGVRTTEALKRIGLSLGGFYDICSQFTARRQRSDAIFETQYQEARADGSR